MCLQNNQTSLKGLSRVYQAGLTPSALNIVHNEIMRVSGSRQAWHSGRSPNGLELSCFDLVWRNIVPSLTNAREEA
ncbi:hypothetical protein AOLI_G00000810 [Acnodon oligacanthus]